MNDQTGPKAEDDHSEHEHVPLVELLADDRGTAVDFEPPRLRLSARSAELG